MGKPFKDLEEVKYDIRNCDRVFTILGIASFILAALGVVSDVLNVTYVLESTSWLLLAILVAIAAISPYLNFVTARNLYGIESEKEKK